MESGGGEPTPATSRKNKGASRTDEQDDDGNEMAEPLQPESERRQIRHNYRIFIDDMKEQQQELINPESDALNERLREADELFRPVKMTREAALDSTAMAIIANYGRQKAQALHTEFIKFQPVEFSQKLMSFVTDQDLREDESESRMDSQMWGKLGDAVQPFFRKSPAFHFMYGSFDREEVDLTRPVQNRAAKQTDNNKGSVTKPEQLPSFQGEKQEATTAEVERILGILQRKYQQDGKVPICYFEFVINPNSFGQTVENIFYASFLIRDDLAKVFLDEDELPVIVPLFGEDGKRSQKDNQRRQAIVSLSKAEWTEIVETFQIEEPIIPSRPSKSKPGVNGVKK